MFLLLIQKGVIVSYDIQKHFPAMTIDPKNTFTAYNCPFYLLMYYYYVHIGEFSQELAWYCD